MTCKMTSSADCGALGMHRVSQDLPRLWEPQLASRSPLLVLIGMPRVGWQPSRPWIRRSKSWILQAGRALPAPVVLASLQNYHPHALHILCHMSSSAYHHRAGRQWHGYQSTYAAKCMDAVTFCKLSSLTTQKLGTRQGHATVLGLQTGHTVISAQAGALIMSQQLHCTARNAAYAGFSQLPPSLQPMAALLWGEIEVLPTRQLRSHTNGLQLHVMRHNLEQVRS